MACPNCGATLQGRYCQDCGQERRAAADLSVRRIIGDAAREFVDLESGALGTLRDLLLRPGYLTTEYLAGRRHAHVSPAKLYLLVSFVFFLFAWDRLMEGAGLTSYFEPGGAFYPQLVQRGLDAGVIAERFNQSFAELTTWLRFASVLVSGVLIWFLYLGLGRSLAEHLIFSFHYFSFEFIISTIYTLAIVIYDAVGSRDAPPWAIWLTYLIVIPYAFLSLRRVYGESVPRAAVKTVVFTIGQFAIYLFVMIVAIALAFILNSR